MRNKILSVIASVLVIALLVVLPLGMNTSVSPVTPEATAESYSDSVIAKRGCRPRHIHHHHKPRTRIVLRTRTVHHHHHHHHRHSPTGTQKPGKNNPRGKKPNVIVKRVKVRVPGPIRYRTVTRVVTKIVRVEVPGPVVRVPVEPKTRQKDRDSDKIDKDPDRGFFRPDVDLDDGEVTIVEAGLGTLALLALMALILVGMYAGYYLGYKDKEQKDTDFMRALLDAAALRRGKKR